MDFNSFYHIECPFIPLLFYSLMIKTFNLIIMFPEAYNQFSLETHLMAKPSLCQQKSEG